MVLGHTFSFEEQEHAERLIKFFRKEGISARIEPASESSLSIFIRGTYDNMRSYLTYLRDELQEGMVDGEGCEMPLDDEEDEDLEKIDSILDTMQMQRENAIRVLEGKNPGDIVYERSTEGEVSQDELIPFFLEFMVQNSILMENHVIGVNNGKLIYKELKPVDELLYTYVVSDGLIPEEDEMETYDITRIQKITAEVDYKVRTGPEIIAQINFDRLREELEDYEVSDEFIAHSTQSIMIKQELAERILHILDNSKAGTLDELTDAVDVAEKETYQDTHSVNSYNISPEYVIQIIEDLKKMEMIRVKGNKIKLNR